MAVTANRSYPYPIASDPPAGHTQIQALANAVDVDMTNVDRWQSGYMTADITVSASTTFVNATGLSLTGVANARYAWRALLFYNANATGKFKFGWTAPALVTNLYGLVGLDAGVTTFTGVTNFQYLTAVGGLLGAPTAASNCFAIAEGVVQFGANAGVYQIQFSQSVASGSTILRQNSMITGRRLT